jgi:hypothetical protein
MRVDKRSTSIWGLELKIKCTLLAKDLRGCLSNKRSLADHGLQSLNRSRNRPMVVPAPVLMFNSYRCNRTLFGIDLKVLSNEN